jgi:hypothetical protein
MKANHIPSTTNVKIQEGKKKLNNRRKNKQSRRARRINRLRK